MTESDDVAFVVLCMREEVAAISCAVLSWDR
jgi:hypothetical protein